MRQRNASAGAGAERAAQAAAGAARARCRRARRPGGRRRVRRRVQALLPLDAVGRRDRERGPQLLVERDHLLRPLPRPDLHLQRRRRSRTRARAAGTCASCSARRTSRAARSFTSPRATSATRSSTTCSRTCPRPATARSRRRCATSASATGCPTTRARSRKQWRLGAAHDPAPRLPGRQAAAEAGPLPGHRHRGRRPRRAPTAARPSASSNGDSGHDKPAATENVPADGPGDERLTRPRERSDQNRGDAKRCLTALAVAALLALAPGGGAAAPKPGTVVEKKVHSAAPHHKQVRESLVRVYDPLPAEVGAHPRGLRLDPVPALSQRRRAAARPRHADAVVVIIPGFLGGAGSFDQVARNTVRRAAERGSQIEYWSLDRRANCLEDDRGIRAAARAEDADDRLRLLLGRQRGQRQDASPASCRPRTRSSSSEFGLERTMEDWYTVLTHGDPGPAAARAQGDLRRPLARRPADRRLRELGLRRRPGDQAATPATSSAPASSASTRRSRSAAAPAAAAPPATARTWSSASGAAPYVNAPPLTPETIQVPTVFGVGAFFDPQGTDLIARAAAHDRTSTSPSASLFSRDAAHFATGEPEHPRLHAHQRGRRSPASSTTTRRRSRSCARASARSVGGPLVDKNFPTPGRRHAGAARGARRRRSTRGRATARSAPPAPRSPLNDAGAAVHDARGRGLRPAPVRAHDVRGAGELHRAVLPDPDPHRRRRAGAAIAAAASSSCSYDGAAAAPGAAGPGRRQRRQLGRRRGPAVRRRRRRTTSS